MLVPTAAKERLLMVRITLLLTPRCQTWAQSAYDIGIMHRHSRPAQLTSLHGELGGSPEKCNALRRTCNVFCFRAAQCEVALHVDLK